MFLSCLILGLFESVRVCSRITSTSTNISDFWSSPRISSTLPVPFQNLTAAEKREVLWYVNSMAKVWLDSDTNTTWLGFEEKKSMLWWEVDTKDYKLWFGFVLVKRNQCWLSVGNCSCPWKRPQGYPTFSFFPQVISLYCYSQARLLKRKWYFGIFIETVAAARKTISEICAGSTGHINTWKHSRYKFTHNTHHRTFFSTNYIQNQWHNSYKSKLCSKTRPGWPNHTFSPIRLDCIKL